MSIKSRVPTLHLVCDECMVNFCTLSNVESPPPSSKCAFCEKEVSSKHPVTGSQIARAKAKERVFYVDSDMSAEAPEDHERATWIDELNKAFPPIETGATIHVIWCIRRAEDVDGHQLHIPPQTTMRFEFVNMTGRKNFHVHLRPDGGLCVTWDGRKPAMNN